MREVRVRSVVGVLEAYEHTGGCVGARRSCQAQLDLNLENKFGLRWGGIDSEWDGDV